MLNSNGHVVFTAGLHGDGITYSGRVYQSSGIWIADGGPLSLVARAGDQAPGLPNGTLYKIPIRLALVKLASYNPAIGTPVLRRPVGQPGREQFLFLPAGASALATPSA
jgi:hypothetical protein